MVKITRIPSQNHILDSENNKRSRISPKSRRKWTNSTNYGNFWEESLLKLLEGWESFQRISKGQMRRRPFLATQVVISLFLLVQCFSLTQASPSPAPVMSIPTDGVYSLFPDEDLKTGRRSFRFEDERDRDLRIRGIRDRNQVLSEPYRDRYLDRERYFDRDRNYDARSNSRFRDDTPIGLRRLTNYHVSRPIEKYNQILFDDERLNYPARLPNTRYRDDRYRDRDYDRNGLRHLYLPPGSPRSFGGFRPSPRLPEPRYPPRPYPPGDGQKATIHVFDPASNSFKPKNQGGSNLPNFPDNVKPGRLYIPGIATSVENQAPGPNTFLNHDEYLEFHTKKALAALDAQEKDKSKKKGDKEKEEEEKKNKAKHLLFSPDIGSLRPPLPNSGSGESSESSSGGGEDGKPELRNQKGKPLEASSSSTKDHKSIHVAVGSKSGQSSSQPQHLRGIPSPTSRSSSPQESSKQIIKGVKSQLGPEVSNQQNQKTMGILSNNINVNGQIGVTHPVIDNSFFTLVNHNNPNSGFGPPVTESIPFTSTGGGFSGFHDQHSLINQNNNFRVDSEPPPLIFLESQDGKTMPEIAKGTNKNMILVRRLKGKHSSSSSSNTTKTESGKSGTTTTLKNSGQVDVETTMKVHRSQADSLEDNPSSPSSKDFNLQGESRSKSGVVSKIYAHIKNCPKLHQEAEVICDVHIRKRHGKPNPQLVVGWKRKFHNATQPDIVLAVNKTLAYEEDFHDKFNVTLAPGISPMLRSVLLIRSVAPPDTGNYQCEVSDGENRLKSDTLLFLCH